MSRAAAAAARPERASPEGGPTRLLVARNAEVIEARTARPVGLAESSGAQTSIALVPRDNAPAGVEVSFATRDAAADHAGLRAAASMPIRS